MPINWIGKPLITHIKVFLHPLRSQRIVVEMALGHVPQASTVSSRSWIARSLVKPNPHKPSSRPLNCARQSLLRSGMGGYSYISSIFSVTSYAVPSLNPRYFRVAVSWSAVGVIMGQHPQVSSVPPVIPKKAHRLVPGAVQSPSPPPAPAR